MDIPALAPSVVVPFRVTVGVTLVTAFAGLGFAIYELVASGWGESFLYATGRSLVFLFVAIAVSIARSAWGAVLAAAALATVNVIDTVIGVIRADALFIVAPLVLALASAASALWLSREIRRSR
ncbi:hypothetical protein [Protaetiibacter mangrovi]|uniref:Uncharacterized protein n=1 Tax=Protaetiibacter mangrovi TaxID=2970926 RepID=A0ABT1ZHI5_9MICO|nr:hypothetical protein [Protaetiibacter mangrovi]MCS0500174.1 hypothetical protein [Protaetiibacter mangrovi]TPX04167.1 hypothetical protein FJ656_13290 [Schumannella luteola]